MKTTEIKETKFNEKTIIIELDKIPTVKQVAQLQTNNSIVLFF